MDEPNDAEERPAGPAERHRQVAGRFTELVRGTADWDAPAPVEGWTARDVVGHLVTWLPEFLAARELPGLDRLDHRVETGLDKLDHREETGLDRLDHRGEAGLDHRGDPVGAWVAHAAAVQALLDGPDAGLVVDDPHLGRHRLDGLVDMIYTPDVFMHTWDLARATGQDDTLDAATCAAMLEGMAPIEDAMRSSGQYGARVDVPADADPQTRLLGFIGRDPHWAPRPSGSGH